jgi:hypothetical protein
LGVYHPEDYGKDSKTYCGMEITDNPYFSWFWLKPMSNTLRISKC